MHICKRIVHTLLSFWVVLHMYILLKSFVGFNNNSVKDMSIHNMTSVSLYSSCDKDAV